MRSMQLNIALPLSEYILPSGSMGSSCICISTKPGQTILPSAFMSLSACGISRVTSATLPSSISRFSLPSTRFAGSMSLPPYISVFKALSPYFLWQYYT